MRKRTIAVVAVLALTAAAVGVGVVVTAAAAEPQAQSCHGAVVSTAVQTSQLGPGMRAAATKFFSNDYPKAVQDAQQVVRAFCASGGPPPGATSSFFVASNSIFWLAIPSTDCFEQYQLANFTPPLPDPKSTERASAAFVYTAPAAMQGQLTILSGVNASQSPYAVSVLSVVTICGAVA